MEKIWRTKDSIDQNIKDKFPEIHPVVLQLLINRGLNTQEQIDEFLNPDYATDIFDPFLFLDMEKSVKRILQGIEKKEKIVVYGDYDADGVSATAILSETLKALGADVSIYIPFRETEGYGLNMDSVTELAGEGTDLLITVDCGISNAPEVAELKKLKVDVIVTDHHQEPLKLPDAFAIINHNTARDTYPYKELAGAGVAYKVAQALIARHSDYKVNQLIKGWEKWLLDIVAIGTVADMMTLTGENRTLVQYGLVVLKKTKRIGLKKLFILAKVDVDNISEFTIGFQIGPRLNAAGRLEHANTAYQLLVTKDPDEAEELAKSIDTTNKQRQQLTEKITKEAVEIIGEVGDKKFLSAVGDGWPTGVLGLIAGRVADRNYRPTFIMSNFGGDIIGSGRSVEGFNLVKALQQCDEYLARYGGHAQACGFTVKDEASIEPFIKKMNELADEALSEDKLIRTLDIDAKVNLSEINWDFNDAVEKFVPFGSGNPKPKFVGYGLNVDNFSTVGQEGKHLRLMVSGDDKISRKTIGFGFGKFAEEIKEGDKVDVVFEVDVNEWNGNRELQLKIVDIKKS